jgi:hypothetical protein
MDQQTCWQTVLQLIDISATVVLAILAIWGDRVRHFWTPPKLQVSLRSRETKVELISNKKTRYLHLLISNANPWNHATGVKVFVTRIERTDADSVDVYDTGNIPLKWQFSEYGMNPTSFGPPRICDLGYLVEGGLFQLATEFVPASCKTSIAAGVTMTVHIRAIADSVESRALVLKLSWDGTWSDDDAVMSTSFSVDVIDQ